MTTKVEVEMNEAMVCIHTAKAYLGEGKKEEALEQCMRAEAAYTAAESAFVFEYSNGYRRLSEGRLGLAIIKKPAENDCLSTRH